MPKSGSSSMSHDKNRPVKGRRDGIVTGNEGAKGGPNVHKSGSPTDDGYTSRGQMPLHGGGLHKREVSGGEA